MDEVSLTLAAQMAALLTVIERDREKWVERRDAVKKIRDRLFLVDEEVTDERAELVATAGLLDQNDKLREQIQAEEREKAKGMIESELASAREMLEKERENVRGSILEELDEEHRRYKSELADAHAKVKSAEAHAASVQQYAEELEGRLADAEVGVGR